MISRMEYEYGDTVAVAQLAEHKVVVLGVAGSIPVGHPDIRRFFRTAISLDYRQFLAMKALSAASFSSTMAQSPSWPWPGQITTW